MESFKNLSEVDSSAPDLKSDYEITLFSRLDPAGFVIDIVEDEEPYGYWEAVKRPNK
jgi:hypothetical protein